MNKTKAKTKSEYPQTAVELTPEIQALLANFTAEEIETGIIRTGRPPESGSHAIHDLISTYKDAVIEDAIGAMLRIARERRSHSLNDAAKVLGVTRARVHQVEQPDANLRIDTLCRFANTYGYKVQLALVPVDGSEAPIVAELYEDLPRGLDTAD